ncbi:hypothetical protein CPC08DRAFT_705130 [Agrocybe pediades]|nr:hypothetical protein CPC08DRAFT_705130 [Agrocybe pediades]
MSSSCSSSSQQEFVLDLLGLGFGPANIAVAAALTEHWAENKDNADPARKVLFIEKHSHFRWHPGMLLPDARMQISFMKDLATLRNPRSRYTFISYLHSQGRLVSFINRGSTIPTRKEYSDYLSWAAAEVQANGVDVLYGHEIIDIRKAHEDTVAVQYRNLATGEETVVRAKNIIISPGGSPRIPAFLAPVIQHPHIIHSSQYATSISQIFQKFDGIARPLRVAVIGSGQSAAEVTMDLRERLSKIPSDGRHIVEMIIRKGSLKPSDDSPFANEIFDPAATDSWYSLTSRNMRSMKLAEYKLTNYGVVNPRTIDALYEIIYDQRLDTAVAQRQGKGAPQTEAWIEIKPYTEIVSVKTHDTPAAAADLLLSPDNTPPRVSPFVVKTQSIIDRAEAEEQYDAIVYATGYERGSWVNILKNSDIAPHFGLNPLSRNVRLVPTSTTIRSQSCTSSGSNSGASTPSNPSSAQSSPPTSPDIESFSKEKDSLPSYHEVHISRNYRLLPVGFVDNPAQTSFAPKIYLQGVEEQTHGLSDTLLSVLGVRAGEVVADLTSRT